MAFNTAYFARMPESKIGHSKFKRPYSHAGTMMHGDIVPVHCKLVSPGEISRIRFAGNIRMSTPISPVYSSIKISYNAFFVPLRLVWNHVKEFFGENTSGAGVPTPGTFTIPQIEINRSNSSYISTRVKVHSVAHYLGFPLYKGSSLDDETYQNKLSVLKLRGYWTIINEWYRHEQIQAPITIATNDNGNAIGQKNGSWLAVESSCQKCLKDFDYFTTCTVAPDFGPDVTLPLGASAPIIAGAFHDLGPNGEVMVLGTNTNSAGPAVDEVANLYVKGTSGSGRRMFPSVKAGETSVPGSDSYANITATNLEADLRNATAASLNEFFLAAAAQTWYYNANYGSRYFEMLQVHYKVTNPDLVLQRPEHIGEAKRFIQVQQVLSTAGAATDSSTKLGQPGANSSTNVEVDFGSHSFGEWGYVYILANTYHEHYYTAGIQREDLYEEMFDFFFPEFSNIGSMAVLRKEAFAASSIDPEEIFGYQEAWSEMRYSNNRLSGLFDPYVSADNSISGFSAPLKGWVLSEKWSSKPLLNEEFILENRDAIKDLLVTGANGPDYIFYYYFDETTISEVPVFSKPGLPGRGRGLL